MTKDDEAPKLDEFRKTMKSATKAQKYSGEEGVKSPDANARAEARNFALEYALKNIVKDKKMAEEILAKRAQIPDAMYDQWLIGAMENETLKGTTHLYENREQVLREAKSSKLESLAKGFMNVQGVEIEGNASHNKIVALQNEYMQHMQIVQAIKQKQQIDETELYKHAVQAGQRENQPIEGEDRQDTKIRERFNNIFNQILSLSPQLSARYIESLAEKRIKQVSEALGSNEAKADYVLRNIRQLANGLAEAHDELKTKQNSTEDPGEREVIGKEMDKVYAQKAQVAHLFYSLVK
jgi:hypothetical protein